MWTPVNRACTALFDVLLWPVSSLPPAWQAIYLGIPAAVLALLVYRYVSNQAGITRAKELIVAHLLELVLFKDDFLVSLRAQGSLLRANLTYLGHALLPMAVMIVPFLLMLVQVESRFAFRPLAAGEAALLTLTLDSDRPVSQRAVELELPRGLVQETPALRVDETGQVVWRVRGERLGDHDLTIAIGSDLVKKRVQVGENGMWVATDLYRASHWETLLYPQEPALSDDGPASVLKLDYPRATSSWIGLSLPSWLFFVSSIGFGFLLRGFFGVTF
jgi:hypothetical protein